MQEIANYYQRFDENKNYEELLIRDGYAIQGAEINDLQKMSNYRVKSIGDALFKDGDVVREAQISINAQGTVNASEGLVYLKGSVRKVRAASFIIPITGIVTVGLRLKESVITELDDPSFYNPAVGSRSEGKAGAWRLKIEAVWAFDNDKQTGEFFPIYVIEDGVQRAKEAPPNLDSFTQGIASYDRDSTAGGTYVVSGLNLAYANNDELGRQVYTLSEGKARVNGYGITLPSSKRLNYNAEPDLRYIDTEVHTASGEVKQLITVAHSPIHNISSIKVTLQKTVSMIHGSYTNAQDLLPDTSIVDILECKQGDTIYVKSTDYKKNGDKIDWSLVGGEPAPGSTYSCTYTYVTNAEAEDLTADNFIINNAVAGSSILVSYNQALPRIDKLMLASDGSFAWLKGVASEINPRPPQSSSSQLALASVFQSWRKPEVINDAVRVVPFSEIDAINKRIDFMLCEIARQRLEADVFTRESGARVGIFVDPLLNDDMRDQGLAQKAAIIDGELSLPIDGKISLLSADIKAPTALSYGHKIILEQKLKTGSMKVNPYMAFEPMPARATLTPNVDFFTLRDSVFTSPTTQYFSSGWTRNANRSNTTSQTTTALIGTTNQIIPNLRQIEINFDLQGFGSGEELRQVNFDGISVTFN